MRAELGLPSVRGDDDKGGGMMGGFGGSMGGMRAGNGKRPIQVKFEIPYFTTSGIQVRYLKIIEPKVCSGHLASDLFTFHIRTTSRCGTSRRDQGCISWRFQDICTDFVLAPISFFALGKVYHAVW